MCKDGNSVNLILQIQILRIIKKKFKKMDEVYKFFLNNRFEYFLHLRLIIKFIHQKYQAHEKQLPGNPIKAQDL